jgi:dienelactone hydrolase
MKSTQVQILTAIILILVFLFGTSSAILLNSDFGKLAVNTVVINDGNKELSGLLYRPTYASADNRVPGIVIAHGISESKDMMSNLGLELSTRGFVVLCLDLIGHGQSEGTVGDGLNEPSFGVTTAVQYLKAQQFVNSSAIGLIGHSLGGGAVRAAAAEDGHIDAVVLIAGGLGDAAQGPEYGTLNSTFPKNLLVIVGKYDVLFNLTELVARELPLVFGTNQTIVPGVLFGDFESQTARKLFTPTTTHLFEPLDATVISQTIAWMQNTFKTPQVSETSLDTNQIYLEREVAILAAIIGLFGIVFLGFLPIMRIIGSKAQKNAPEKRFATFGNWRAYIIWDALNLALFLPMVFVGFAIAFPPLIFGASIAWWMLATGIIGLLLLTKNLPRSFISKIGLKETLQPKFDRKNWPIAIMLIVILFVVAILLEIIFVLNLRIIAPLFQVITSVRRFGAFLAFIPFSLAYFAAEGLYLHEFIDKTQQRQQGNWVDLRKCVKTVLLKIAPFLAVICLQYFPKVFFNVWILQGTFGFLVEFLWLIIPIFIITTVSSWWFYKNTGGVGTGAVFNAILLAWIASVVFPF